MLYLRVTTVFVTHLAVILLATVLAGETDARIIDDFSLGGIVVERLGDTAATAEQSGLDPVHVVGGGRSFVVGDFGSPTQTLALDDAMRVLTFETGSTPGYFSINYGSSDSPLGVDLTANGSTAFQIDYSFDGDSTLVQLRFDSPTGEAGARIPQSDSQVLPNGRRRTVVPFADFPFVDFTNITSLALTAGRFPGNSSIKIYGIETVPEPSAVLLMVAASSFVLQGARCRTR